MNFLAHLYLGDYGHEESAGSVLADFIKGKRNDNLPSGIIEGIKLHLAIDDFTDHHPVFRATRTRLHKKFSHYAPVVADVFYDHFLAVNWSQYSEETLENFTKRAFQNMKMHRHHFPLRLTHIFLYNRFQKLLLSYRSEKGVKYAFIRLSRRARFHSGFDHALDELEENYQLYQKEFFAFFPDVQKFAKEYMKNKKYSE